MPEAELERKIADAVRQLDQARSRSESAPDVGELLETLGTSLEELHVAEEALHEQNEVLEQLRADAEQGRRSYQQLFDLAPDPYLVTDLRGAITEANRAAGTMLGLDPVSLAGKPLDIYLAADERPAFAVQLRRLAEAPDRTLVDWPVSIQPRRGAPIPTLLSAASFGPGQGQSGGIRWQMRDISALVHAQQELEATENTIAAIADGIIVYDREGRIRRISAAAQRILRYTTAELALPGAERLQRLQVWTEDEQPVPPEQSAMARALHGETVQGVVYHLRPETGRDYWVTASSAPVRGAGGKTLGAVLTFSDITPQHELQVQREDILRAVSHDLRNPLTVVLGQGQLLRRYLEKDGLAGRERTSLEAMLTSAQRMNAMIQDLVDAARLESGQLALQPERVDLLPWLNELLARLQGTLATERLQVVAEASLPPVWADPDRLERILVNLTSNALKYGPPDTPVTVRLAAQDGQVVTSVHDRGPGIPPDEQARLFQRYYRAGGGTKRPEGLGLGLYISRMLVEAQGGRIWVESTPGQGSTFSFSLPVAPQ